MTAALKSLVVLLTLALLGVGQPASAQDGHGTPPTYTPPMGALFSSPLNGHGRDILTQVIRSIHAAPKGSTIRFAVWNFADRPTTDALIDAKERGVKVQVVVAQSVTGKQWFRIRAALSQRTDDDSFAIRCHGACRSNRYVMHSKIFLFSRTGKQRHVSMFGSSNLTAAAGNRQWNDQTTTNNKGLYDFFVQTFDEYAADTPVATAHDDYEGGRYSAWLFPRPDDNPIAAGLEKVRCHDPHAKTGKGRTTVVRIAVAGWFDEFGLKVAQQVRRLWDAGCDLRIVTTLAGRKINRVLKRRYGRGRVPIRQVTVDNDHDGEPERYLHMKSIAVSGYVDGTPHTHVLFTGSPNWSGEARASDEVFVEIRDAKALVAAYSRFIDQMFFGPAAHHRMQMMKRPALRSGAESGYELD